MDDGGLPSAEELGVSEDEYARILRGLRGRLDIDAPDPSTPEALSPRRGRGTLALAVVSLLFLGLARLLDTSGGSEPVHAFLQMDGDRPVTYTSCRPIPVAVYPAGGPPDALALVEEAVGRMRSATGLDLQVTGAFGGHAPGWNFQTGTARADDPINISWQDDGAIPRLTDDVAGLGVSPTVTNRDGTRRYVAGTIMLSADYYEHLTATGDHDEALAVLLHEFGHVVGLDHVDSSAELMNGDNTGRTTWGAGDLEGLRRLGQGPCV